MNFLKISELSCSALTYIIEFSNFFLNLSIYEVLSLLPKLREFSFDKALDYFFFLRAEDGGLPFVKGIVFAGFFLGNRSS